MLMPNDVVRDYASQSKMYKHYVYTHTHTHTHRQTSIYIRLNLAFLSCILLACSTNRNVGHTEAELELSKRRHEVPIRAPKGQHIDSEANCAQTW